MTAFEYRSTATKTLPLLRRSMPAAAGQSACLRHAVRGRAEAAGVRRWPRDPLGILPYKNDCYVQRGPDIVFLSDTDDDGKADKREVILTGFGVRLALVPTSIHTRARWLDLDGSRCVQLQQVRRPDEPPERATKFDQTHGEVSSDSSGFEITSQGRAASEARDQRRSGPSFRKRTISVTR